MANDSDLIQSLLLMESSWQEKASQRVALFCEQDEVFPNTHRSAVKTKTFLYVKLLTLVD